MDSTINNEQINETAQIHATTAFTAQDQAKDVTPHGPVSEQYDILSSKDFSNLSLHELLSQPVPVASGVLTNATTAFTLNSHSSILTTSPFHLEKLKGYHGIRATVVCRIVVNADKYTQGVLAIGYLPINNETIDSRTDHRMITQLNHVELDVNVETEVVLRIPHRGPYTHFDIVNRRFDPGVFLIAPTLPFNGNPVPYTIYMSYEDVDLLGPTSTFQVSYQSGMGKNRVTIEEETADKPISTALGRISSALTVAGSVPVLTPFVEPMAWATGIASAVASAFGYSKPCVTTTPNVYVRRDIAKLNHTDGADYAEQLAMTTTTGVRISDQIGLTNHDEMSFAYLCGIRSQMYQFNHSTTTPNGTKLFSFPLDPYSMKTNLNWSPAGTGAGEYQAFIMHPMAYIANMFSYYRGSIEVTLHIAKTIFHTGRLLVVFEPTYSDDTVAFTDVQALSRVNTIQDAINCHKDIVDLRSGNKFSFAFPFTSLTPYLPVGRPYGWVHIFALNSLVRNDTAVADEVSIGVRVNACDDMEFAGPGDPVMWPLTAGPSADSQALDNRTLDGVVYQSGLEVKETCIVSKPIGSSSIPPPTTAMSELCIGEKILSMKQVAMRGKVVEISEGTATPQYDPFVIDVFRQTNFLAPSRKPWFDFYSYAGALYIYGRGGVILSIQKSDQVPLIVGIKTVEYDNPNEPRDVYGEFSNILPMRSEPGGDRVYVPPYNASFVRYNHFTPATSTSAVDKTAGNSQTKLRMYSVIGPDGTTRNALVYNIYRSAAEDTQFGAFRGVPPMVYRDPYHQNFAVRGAKKITSYAFPISSASF